MARLQPLHSLCACSLQLLFLLLRIKAVIFLGDECLRLAQPGIQLFAQFSGDFRLLWRDVRSATDWRTALAYCFAPPGWDTHPATRTRITIARSMCTAMCWWLVPVQQDWQQRSAQAPPVPA